MSFAVPENNESGDRAEVEEDAEQHVTSLARAIAASRDLIELGSVAVASVSHTNHLRKRELNVSREQIAP